MSGQIRGSWVAATVAAALCIACGSSATTATNDATASDASADVAAPATALRPKPSRSKKSRREDFLGADWQASLGQVAVVG